MPAAMPTPMRTIVFDLDGTLIDTAPDLIATLNITLAREGMAAVPYEEARKMIGGGARGMIEKALIAEGRADRRKPTSTACSATSSNIMPPISPITRARFRSSKPRSIDLAADGYRLAVCTNKLEWLSVRLLDTLNLTRHFAAICGQDTFGMQKPEPGSAPAHHRESRRRARSRHHGRRFRNRRAHRPRRLAPRHCRHLRL